MLARCGLTIPLMVGLTVVASAGAFVNFDVDPAGDPIGNGHEITDTYAVWGVTFGASGPSVHDDYEGRALAGISQHVPSPPNGIGWYSDDFPPAPMRRWREDWATARADFSVDVTYVRVIACVHEHDDEAFLTAFFDDGGQETVYVMLSPDMQDPDPLDFGELLAAAPSGRRITHVEFSGRNADSLIRFDNFSFAVPEPGTTTLLLTGLCIVAFVRRLRRRPLPA